MWAVSPEMCFLTACKAGARGKCSGKPGGNPVSGTGCSSGLPLSIADEDCLTISNSIPFKTPFYAIVRRPFFKLVSSMNVIVRD
ncbi:hypothetical protein DPMN_141114 [Dreissena polymorpha]|uniref:Uncharacterized protein n=1 Tax=Dreissena polymorpha TaxID=45954 RepID=A0A9D4JHB0_DREPO|nr:hypothetical protein DPMN_141114 [Dreissena polymorpha]